MENNLLKVHKKPGVEAPGFLTFAGFSAKILS